MNQSDKISALLGAVSIQAKAELAPIVGIIDQDGRYPTEYLDKLGILGGFSSAVSTAYGGLGLGLATQISITSRVGIECGATAFLVWCQSTCAWYLQYAPNEAVRKRYLKPVSQGTLRAGTGMSNTVKHLAGIETILLHAQRDGDDYIVSGALPWVSNAGAGHLVIAAAAVEGEGYMMFAAQGNIAGLRLNRCPEFSGLEGTRTHNMLFNEVRISPDHVLAHPNQFFPFIQRIKPGFVLGQTGMGFGIIEGSLKTIRESNANPAQINEFLDDHGANLAVELAELKAQASLLAQQEQAGTVPVLEVLKLRARTSELTLRAANSAILHAGAKGYLMRHPAQRRLREAVFVAIVTPSLKHLRKEIQMLEQKGAQSRSLPQSEAR